MATYIVSAHLIGNNIHQTSFEAGQQVRLDLTVWGSSDTLADPGAVTLKTRTLGSASVTQTAVKDAVGQYHFDLTVAAGPTNASWTGTGVNPGAASLTIDTVPVLVP
jgi:hypothetical protein